MAGSATGMAHADVVRALAALAHDARLAVFKLLVQAGPDGLAAGVLAEQLAIAPSALSFHLKELTHAGLLDQFTRAGAGNAAQSWVGSGANQSVSPDQVTQALGPDVIGQIASQLGVGHGDAAGGIAHILPELIDKLTPNGQAPQGGLGSGDEIVGMLGKLLQR